MVETSMPDQTVFGQVGFGFDTDLHLRAESNLDAPTPRTNEGRGEGNERAEESATT
jgi:hypothetical protein